MVRKNKSLSEGRRTSSNRHKIEYAAMAQEVEHFLGKEEVTGSNPVSSSRRETTRYCGFSLILRLKNHKGTL